jgi:hypothetical protein
VVLWPFDPFAPPPPPSHASARRRWIFRWFRSRSCRLHLPHVQERDGGGFMALRPRSRCHHLPRRRELDGGGFYVFSTPFALLPPSSHATARRGGFMWPFDPVHAATSSLVCNSETEVGFYVISTPFALPPPSHTRARRRWIFRGFRPHSCRLYLPRMQEQDGGGFYVFSTPFALPPPPSHAIARRRWVLCRFNPFCMQHRHHLPRVQE